MKTKHIFMASFFCLLTVFMLHTPSLEARSHHSTNVQFRFGVNVPPAPRPYYREAYVVREYHYYPQPCQRHVHVYPAQEVVYVHPAAPCCPRCRY